MTANNTESYSGCSNKLLDEYNKSYYHSIGKKPINAAYSTLNEKIETNTKAHKLKIGDKVKIT